MQETLSIKVTAAEKSRLRAIAAQRGLSLSALLKEGLQAVAAGAVPHAGPTCHDLIAPYLTQPGHIGASGRGDLSTNKQHLKDFGHRKK